jgi:hypothetical protein
MDIKTFLKVAPALPPDIALLVRGPHGIGKSQLFRQIAEGLGFSKEDFIDRRLSQMTEGDLLGLPELTDGVTRFAPPDWYMSACLKAKIVLLDEFNRATPEVMQCGFQIVLDHELNGWKLHPETRVYAAVNASPEYTVNEMDPALLDRFWTIDLEPTVEDWINWATGAGIDPVMVDFIRQNPGHLRHSGQIEPGKVYPSQRSWDRLDQSLKKVGIDLTEAAGTAPDLLYPISLGFVGLEGAITFRDFVKNYESILSAEDVLDRWTDKSVKDKIKKLTADKQNGLMDKILITAKKATWSPIQVSNIAAFVKSVSAEMTVSFFNKLMETNQLENIRNLHKHIGPELIKNITAATSIKK